MRTLIAILLALYPSPRPSAPPSTERTLAYRMPELGSTITHLVLYSSGRSDKYSIGWTGSVPQAATGWVVPKYGVGPFSSSAKYTLGSGSDALDVAAHTLCILFTPTVDNGEILYYNGAQTYVQIAANGTVLAHLRGSSGADATTVNTVTLNSPNIMCAGNDGAGKDWVQLNAGTAYSASVTRTVETTGVATVGTYASSLYPFTGKLHEFMFSTAAWDTAAVATIETAVIARLTVKP